MRARAVAILAVCAFIASAALPAGAETVWGAVSASRSEDPGFAGYWKYCMEIEWNTLEMGGYGMSHLSFFLGLETCGCACDPHVFALAEVAGTGSGMVDCQLDYRGEFLCRDDPSFPGSGPTVKFEDCQPGCEPSGMGAAVVCFYSAFPPGQPGTHADVLGVKAGKMTSTGDLTGTLPMCVCGSPVQATTWGTVKAIYRLQ